MRRAVLATGGPILAGLALAVLAAGCAEPSYPTQPPTRAQVPASPSAPTGPLPILPMPGSELATPAPPSRRAGRDSCGAAELQALVGQPRTAIPVPVDPSRQRVACTTCPAADDVDPRRITFLFDAKSGLIQQIRCG